MRSQQQYMSSPDHNDCFFLVRLMADTGLRLSPHQEEEKVQYWYLQNTLNNEQCLMANIWQYYLLTYFSYSQGFPCHVMWYLVLTSPSSCESHFAVKNNMQSSNNIQDFLCKTLAYVTTYELAVSLESGMAHIRYFIHSGQFLQIHEV